MTTHDEALNILARQLQCPDDLPPERRRADLERVLLPLVRCALRSGRGVPRLVRWVRQNAPTPPTAADTAQALPPDWAAPTLSRKLCTLLLEKIESNLVLSGARETVVSC